MRKRPQMRTRNEPEIHRDSSGRAIQMGNAICGTKKSINTENLKARSAGKQNDFRRLLNRLPSSTCRLQSIWALAKKMTKISYKEELMSKTVEHNVRRKLSNPSLKRKCVGNKSLLTGRDKRAISGKPTTGCQRCAHDQSNS